MCLNLGLHLVYDPTSTNFKNNLIIVILEGCIERKNTSFIDYNFLYLGSPIIRHTHGHML